MNFAGRTNYILIQNKNLIVSILFLLSATAVSVIFSLSLTGGHFTYALDDPYIHMSIVKHLATQLKWSVDGKTYATASSSPLWDIILIPFYLLTGHKMFVYVPFVLNVVFQILSLTLMFRIVKKYTGHELHCIFGIITVLVVPFIPLSLGGMEHSLQIFLVLFFVDAFISYTLNPSSKTSIVSLLCVSPFMVFVRYEDFALVFSVAVVILLYFKNWKLSLSLIFAGFSLVTVFGLWSKFVLHLGFFPESIMAKSIIGNRMTFSLITTVFDNFRHNFLRVHIAGMYLLNLFILFNSLLSGRKWLFLLSAVFVSTLLIHLAFAKVGWLYRYEAYLMIFGLLNIFLYIHNTYKVKTDQVLIAVLFLIPVFHGQVFTSISRAIIGTKNIYEQQIQMADFLHDYCDSCSVAANDIGAITYYTHIHLLDLVGLANYDVLKHRKEGTFNSRFVNHVLVKDHVSLIMIYDKWFKGIHFKNYTRIGSWTIKHNEVCGGSTVSFYSVNNQIPENIRKFREYSESELPKDVTVKFLVSD